MASESVVPSGKLTVSRTIFEPLKVVVRRWAPHDLSGAQHLTEALVLSKENVRLRPS